jgi:hypothetical protein
MEAQKRGEYRGEAAQFGFTYDAEGMASRAISADLVRLGIKLSRTSPSARSSPKGRRRRTGVRREGS